MLGITAGQGYYLGRPGPISAVLGPEPGQDDPDEPLVGVAAWRRSIGLTSVG
jgi:hypothetical protein